MHTKRIINPITGKKNTVYAWHIIPSELISMRKTEKFNTREELGMILLAQHHLIAEATEYSDDPLAAFALNIFNDDIDHNFARFAFEQNLAQKIGARIFDVMNTAKKANRLPKPFEVLANRAGQVFLLFASGKII